MTCLALGVAVKTNLQVMSEPQSSFQGHVSDMLVFMIAAKANLRSKLSPHRAAGATTGLRSMPIGRSVIWITRRLTSRIECKPA
jgi:hypothetical protein